MNDMMNIDNLEYLFVKRNPDFDVSEK